MSNNLDPKVVSDFGKEWASFDQRDVPREELTKSFEDYFDVFPWDSLPADARGIDVGCGSGRWAQFVAPRVRELHCIDPSTEALEVARKNLSNLPNCQFYCASVDSMPVADNSMDFGYSLGVLHHIPDTAAGIRDCVTKLKPGAPFLVYLYYAFDNRPAWFIALWKISDWIRRLVSALPYPAKYLTSQVIAATVYFPLSRIALILEKFGMNVENMPLSAYRDKSFYSQRTDALDRFGTRLEQRFTKVQIESMMRAAGLDHIRFSNTGPFWGASGIKVRAS
jgi:ubiquinone/menaquinone biosynthesis C-methylase UbiE